MSESQPASIWTKLSFAWEFFNSRLIVGTLVTLLVAVCADDFIQDSRLATQYNLQKYEAYKEFTYRAKGLVTLLKSDWDDVQAATASRTYFGKVGDNAALSFCLLPKYENTSLHGLWHLMFPREGSFSLFASSELKQELHTARANMLGLEEHFRQFANVSEYDDVEGDWDFDDDVREELVKDLIQVVNISHRYADYSPDEYTKASQ